MGQTISAKMLIGAPTYKIDLDKMRQKAIDWKISADSGFADDYERTAKVVEIHPTKYRKDLDLLGNIAWESYIADFFYQEGLEAAADYFGAEWGNVTVGFKLDQSISINQFESKEWLEEVKNKAKRFKEIFDVEAALIANEHVC